MGANTSVQQSEILNSTVQNIVSESINEITNSTNADAYSNQKINMDMSYADLVNCKINIKQESKVTAGAFADTNNELSNDVSSKLSTIVQNQLEQSVKQANEGLNIGAVNTSVSMNKTKNYIEQNMHTLVRNSINNVVRTSAKNDQELNISARYLTCRNGEYNVSQGTIIDAVAKNISSTVVQNVLASEGGVELSNTIKQATDQFNKGLDLGFGLIIVVLLALMYGGYKMTSNKWIVILVAILIAAAVTVWMVKRKDV